MSVPTMDPPTATLIRRDCDAFNSGDMDTVRTTFDGSIAWRCAGKSRFSGDQHGIDNTLAYFLELKQATGGTLHLDVHDVVADHEHAAALVTSSFEVGAKQYTDIGSHVVPHQGRHDHGVLALRRESLPARRGFPRLRAAGGR